MIQPLNIFYQVLYNPPLETKTVYFMLEANTSVNK